jgi:hypothetical protein
MKYASSGKPRFAVCAQKVIGAVEHFGGRIARVADDHPHAGAAGGDDVQDRQVRRRQPQVCPEPGGAADVEDGHRRDLRERVEKPGAALRARPVSEGAGRVRIGQEPPNGEGVHRSTLRSAGAGGYYPKVVM